MTSSLTSPTNSLAAKQLGLPDLAFVGKAGAGKSTAASLLAQLGYAPLSFAQELKSIAARLWGEDGRSDRDKLQRLGVAVREIDPDAWVNVLLRTKGDHRSYSSISPRPESYPLVIDDCRFENEWYALKGEGFVIVRVEAPRSLRIDRLKANGKWQDEAQLHHISETAVDHLTADYTIQNDDTQDNYYDELIEIIIRERRRR